MTTQSFSARPAAKSSVKRLRVGRALATKLMLGVVTPLVLLSIWQIAAVVGLIDERLFPAPTTVIATAYHLTVSGVLPEAVGVTLRRILIGYACGAACGVTVGLLLGRMPLLRAAVGPTIAAIYTIPMLAILPLILIIFGIGDFSRILLVAIISFLVTAIGTTEGSMNVHPGYVEAGRAFGAKRLSLFVEVILPGALVATMASLRLALGLAILVGITTEFLVASDGLGYMIWNSWSVLDAKTMYAGLLVTGLLGAAASGSIALLQRYAFPWTRVEGSRRR